MSAPLLRFGHAAFTIVLYLFREYLAEQGLDSEQAESVCIAEFYTWVNQQVNEYGEGLFPDKEDLQLTHKLTNENFEWVEQMFSDPFIACSYLSAWWPLLCMSGRKPLRHKVKAVTLIGVVQFEDDTVVKLPVTPSVATQEAFTDGLILSVWSGQLNVIREMIVKMGADKLHDMCTQMDAEMQRAKYEGKPGGLGF